MVTTRSHTDLAKLHHMLTADGIPHTYTDGDSVLTVTHNDRVWTISDAYIIDWCDTDIADDAFITLCRNTKAAHDIIIYAYGPSL